VAKRLGKKLPKVEEITLYYTTLHDLRPHQAADLRNAMREFGEDIGTAAHASMRAKQQVLGKLHLGPQDRRRWFMEAVLAIREERNKAERARRRAHIAKQDAIEASRRRKARYKAGRPNEDS